MEDIENMEQYKGEEQVYIKPPLLKAYLRRLFMIMGQCEKQICYVDLDEVKRY